MKNPTMTLSDLYYAVTLIALMLTPITLWLWWSENGDDLHEWWRGRHNRHSAHMFSAFTRWVDWEDSSKQRAGTVFTRTDPSPVPRRESRR